MRDLAQILAHVHEAEIEIGEGPEPPARESCWRSHFYRHDNLGGRQLGLCYAPLSEMIGFAIGDAIRIEAAMIASFRH